MMRLIRLVLLAGAAWYVRRVLHGRGHEVLQRARDEAVSHLPGRARHTTRAQDEHGHHTSAASAANEGFRDDRDVTVGEQFSAVGMRPGAR